MQFIGKPLLFTALFTLCSGSIAAQGQIRGQVLDGAGAPLAGATVVITGPQGQQSAVANRDGYYMFAGLPGGNYDIRTRMTGYPSTLILRVELQGSRPLELDCQLTSDQELYRVHSSPVESRIAVPVIRLIMNPREAEKS